MLIKKDRLQSLSRSVFCKNSLYFRRYDNGYRKIFQELGDKNCKVPQNDV